MHLQKLVTSHLEMFAYVDEIEERTANASSRRWWWTMNESDVVL